jgi:CDP-diacylglycerol--glycerol-3-phosphate 3-phosphatidyltransferase
MNLPNRITIARIIMIPVFMLFAFPLPAWFPGEKFFSGRYSALIALILYIIASVTDTVDGHIARKYNLITSFGKFLDPIADKLLVMAAMLALVPMNKMYLWIAMIILTREFIVTGVRLVAASEGVVIAAGKGGKLKMVLQTIALITLLASKLFEGTTGLAETIGAVVIVFGDVMLIAAAIVTIVSGFEYVKNNLSLIAKDM